VLGHALKAIGVLRAISECAAPEDCDPSAEGWWDTDSATFRIRSDRYPDANSLAKFFAESYQPTPIIAAWNKSGGVTDKIEVTVSCNVGSIARFCAAHELELEGYGLKKEKQISEDGILTFPLSSPTTFESLKVLTTQSGLTCQSKSKTQGKKTITEVTIAPNTEHLTAFVTQQRNRLTELGLGATKKLSTAGQLKFSSDSANRAAIEQLIDTFNTACSSSTSESPQSDEDSVPGSGPLSVVVVAKESGKKDGTLPNASRLLFKHTAFQECLEHARRFVALLQASEDSDEDVGDVFLRYRDHLPDAVAESFDALCTLHLTRDNDNPLFIRRGRPGDKVNADIFLNFWDFFVAFRKCPGPFSHASLFNASLTTSSIAKKDQKGKGTPFFPDAIKNYNQGADWVTEDYPFCPLDYLLAVEGALAMRGATSKTLNARSRTRAAFPFVFEAAETMTDDEGKVLRLATSFWFPIWTQPTGYHELQSFILDSQARLSSKECRFSSDFGRAVRSQGVDAGFFAFQEFRFKMRGAPVPWTTGGRFVPCTGNLAAGVLNELLAPVDESGFLNQFEFHTSRETRADLHPLRAPVLEAIEDAAAEPDGKKILDVLCRLADLNAHLAKSKSLREKVGGRVTFVPPLRCDDWAEALAELDGDREFEIARALASILGRERQSDGTYSKVEPFLGSLVPLQRGQRNWFLPDPPSPQAVWSGIDLHRDLAAILARRVIDSEADFRPALVGSCSARLSSIMAFLRGDLDDRRIARLVEALSLIDWPELSTPCQSHSEQATETEERDAVPVAYAAVRSLVERACERDDVADVSTARAKVQRTVSLVTRQEPGMVAAGVAEALRRLAIVGIPNTYGLDSRGQKPKLAGRDVIAVGTGQVQLQCDSVLSRRLAAAVLIPLDRQDRWRIFRAITLPQST
jgi:CRISPR-associated protein Csx17